MKKILLFISLLLFTGIAFSQTRKYFERLNANLTIDSGYVKLLGDSVFNYSGDTFICRTKQFYDQFYNPDYPNGFANFHLDADNVYRNFTPKAQGVDWTGVGNNPGTTVGLGLYSLATPATASLIRVNSNGTTVTRTVTEAKQDLSIDQIDNTSDANKPISTAQQTALNLKANISSPTFTGTVSGITASMVGLGNVNNTSDASKPVSTATQTALNLKQDISGNNGGWSVLRVAGSNATTTGQTLVDITGLVTPTLTNATLYEVEAVLYCSTSAVTTGTQYAFTANGTGGAATVFINVSGTTTTNAATTVTQSASGTAAGTFLTTSGASGIIVMKGFILTRGSGTATIALQHLKITSGTSTVFIGSVLRYRLAQ